VPQARFESEVQIARAEGSVTEFQAQRLPLDGLSTEWEWEDSPEISLVVVDSLEQSVDYFNTYSPRLAATLISEDAAEHQQFFDQLDAPFVGDDHTRWVDGQFALNKPELGLSNWANGRLFGRGAVLTGDSVYTVRTRYLMMGS
jgi:glutamate-5-semialdehyde dehydrogenase